MTPHEKFFHWRRGFLDGRDQLTAADVDRLREHMRLVNMPAPVLANPFVSTAMPCNSVNVLNDGAGQLPRSNAPKDFWASNTPGVNYYEDH